MRTRRRRLGGLAVFVALLLLGTTASTAGTGSRQQPCGVASALPSPPLSRPHYVLSVHVLQGLQVAQGRLVVSFTAPTALATDELVFRLWPNAPRYARSGGHLSVTRVREGRRLVRVSDPNRTTLVVHQPVAAGERVVLSMNWRLVLPREEGLRMKGRGRSVRLASFFPLLAWEGNDWALDAPTRLRAAEAWTSPTADFDVRVTHPSGLGVLASGVHVGRGSWHAKAVRDFALALGHFKIISGTAHVPAPVRVTVGVEEPSFEPPRLFLRSAIASLERYSALYAPYPWKTYTVAAMVDTGGYEYPTLVYQPASDANLAHETAHQWFYSLVGDDQARDPWLDEGLATWAEAAMNGAPPFADAEIPPDVANRIGEPMTFWDRFDERRFFLGVYLQTYRALLSLGTRSEIDCALRVYVDHNAYRVARPNDLLRALQAFVPDAKPRLEAFGAHF